MRILVVDDCPDIRGLLASLLALAGWTEVVPVSSARDALAFLRATPRAAGGHPADLILLDVAMPGMDGIELLGILKADPALAEIPVVLLTARKEPAFIERAFAAGAFDYITKPFDRAELAERVRAALQYKLQSDLDRARIRHLTEAARRLEAELAALRNQAGQDALTGLASRSAFDGALEREWRRAARALAPLTIVLVDVDDFAAFTRRRGSLAGNVALKEVGREAAARATRPGSLVARLGTASFAVLLPEARLGEGVEIGRSIRKAVADLTFLGGSNTRGPDLTVSVGVIETAPTLDRPATLRRERVRGSRLDLVACL
ncbi:MAG: response regulator [Candidatus Sericytochromatia bacterium]|nr:response regulator [Candidatus Tanganyikabacteria bacterium]